MQIDCSAVARISKGLFTPATSPARSLDTLSASTRSVRSFVDANMQGQCTAEIWVATSHETYSHIEVVSVFSPSEKVRLACLCCLSFTLRFFSKICTKYHISLLSATPEIISAAVE